MLLRAACLILVTSVTIVGCGGDKTLVFRDRGIEFRYPVDWSVTRSAVVSPVRVVVASYPLPREQIDACHALSTVPPSGVALLILDYGNVSGSTAFARRPRHLRMRQFARGNYQCFGESYMLRFRVGEHNLQAHVRFGDDVNAATRQQALRLLESIDSDKHS